MDRPGSRQTGLKIFHIIAQPGWPGLTAAAITKLAVHSFFVRMFNFGEEAECSWMF